MFCRTFVMDNGKVIEASGMGLRNTLCELIGGREKEYWIWLGGASGEIKIVITGQAESRQIRLVLAVRLTTLLRLAGGGIMSLAAQSPGQALNVNVSRADARYTIAMPGSDSYALQAGVGAEVDGHALASFV
ncbi:MAG TPA: hypothetical protein VN901_11905 [Candidatus Acidoferrales bacterium]|nr:hypothetical protein [Candidatus Acidoferrales bacterium]